MKNLSRLTALLLALMMLFTSMPAFATESEAIPVDEFEAADYASLLSIAEEDAAATADASWGNIFDGMPCAKENVYCQNVLHMLECPNAQKRYEYLNSLYSEYGVDLEFTMLHYYFYHVEDQENMTDSVVCTCSFPFEEPEYVIPAPGDISKHDESCPWHFANLSLAEQYDVIRDMDADTQETYKETLSAESLDTLNRVNVSEYETGNSAANIAINVPDGAFAADYLLDVQDVGKQQAMLDAILAEMGEDAIADHVAAFDITFGNLVSGNEMQPDEAVQMMFTIPTASLPAVEGEQYLHVFHMIENSDGTYAAESAASNIAINAETENQSLTVKAKAFSTYYVVAGTSDNSSQYDTTIRDLPGETSTYYVEPGTSIQFNTNTTLTLVEADAGITLSNKTVTIAASAAIGAEASIKVGSSYTIRFVVDERNDIIVGAISSQPVYLSIKTSDKNTSPVTNHIPSEPAIINANFKRLNSNYSPNTGWSWERYIFSESAVNYIDTSIVNELLSTADGSSTTGVYDATGTICLKYLKNIDWEKMMTVAVNQGAYATDGVKLTTQNKDSYVIVPYVIKYMSEVGIGWHIDCIAVPANRITLSYDLNLKNYIVSDTLSLPNAVTSASGLINTSVGYIKKGSSNLNVNGTVSATLDGTDYTLKFLGWSTDPNASTAEYAPNANISVDKDTVLYAVWSGKAVLGTLEIRKTVSGNNAPANDEFTFTVTFSKSVTLGYTVSDLSGNVVNRGNIASGGSLKLKNGQTATIVEVPIGSYSVVESPAENYTTTSTGANGTITEDGTSTAVFTNTYVEPTVTINYVAVGGGIVTPPSETVGIYSEASGSTATANTNYKFVGWFTDRDCKVAVTAANGTVDGNKFTPAKVDGKNVEATYFAKFEELPTTITYVPVGPNGRNDGAGNVDPASETINIVTGVASGSTATANEHYEFVGWYEEEACTTLVTKEADFTPTKAEGTAWPSTEIDYFAKFVEKKVTINYVVVGPTGCGTVDPASETLNVLTGTANGSTATAATNYHFVGWYTDEACETAVDSTLVDENNKFVPAKDADGKNVAATYYAKFEEDEVKINYVAVGPTGATNFGSVSPENENVKVLTGVAQGSTATAVTPTFKFVGWFDNEKCEGEALSTDAKYVPTKEDGTAWVDGTTYYAKFDWHIGNLKITKTNMQDGESAIFKVVVGDETYRIVLNATNTYATISGLLHDTAYTVTEESWSWSYNGSLTENSAPASGKIVAGETITVSFKNTKDEQWLYDESSIKNVFRNPEA
ncbi:MAG: hypothetical protein E7337_04885 [Clostridiales bacterium]|nr:hypothetical protein [Clostridiales bacterium]